MVAVAFAGKILVHPCETLLIGGHDKRLGECRAGGYRTHGVTDAEKIAAEHRSGGTLCGRGSGGGGGN